MLIITVISIICGNGLHVNSKIVEKLNQSNTQIWFWNLLLFTVKTCIFYVKWQMSSASNFWGLSLTYIHNYCLLNSSFLYLQVRWFTFMPNIPSTTFGSRLFKILLFYLWLNFLKSIFVETFVFLVLIIFRRLSFNELSAFVWVFFQIFLFNLRLLWVPLWPFPPVPS